MQAQRALVDGLSLRPCLYVCMSVCYGFMIEITAGLRIVYVALCTYLRATKFQKVLHSNKKLYKNYNKTV